MGKFSDYVLITDYDGTLVGKNLKQNPRNVQAMQYFQEKGGRIGIATGRSTEFIAPVAQELAVNFPCVLYNGGVVYDYGTEQILFEELLVENAFSICKTIRHNFPTVGILAISDVPGILEDEEALLEIGAEKRLLSRFQPVNPWKENRNPWYKVLFSGPSEQMKEIEDFVKEIPMSTMRFVRSGETLMELLPVKSNKASALQVALKKKGVVADNVIAIGDYFNDLEMISFAGLGATLQTAPQEIQQKADYIGGTVEQGIVADVIQYIDKMCNKR